VFQDKEEDAKKPQDNKKNDEQVRETIQFITIYLGTVYYRSGAPFS
jgi:hypothetical protein